MDYILQIVENDDVNKANSSLKMKKDMIDFLRKHYNGNNILEYGTAWGNTTAILAQICKEKGCKVYTIDLFPERLQKTSILMKN